MEFLDSYFEDEVSLFSHVLPELFSFLPPKNDKQTILPPHYSSKTPAVLHKKDNHASHRNEKAENVIV